MALFGAESGKAKLWRISEGEVSIGGTAAYAINIEISVSRQLNPVATIGKGIQWAAQPTTGQCTVGTILTSDANLVSALGADGAGCESKEIVLKGNDKTCEAKGTVTIKDGYCSQVVFTASGQQGYIGQNLTVMFTACEVS